VEPGDQLAAGPQHRRHEQVDLAVVGHHRREQRLGRVAHLVGRPQPEPHEAPLGLVGDAVAPELDHDREPDLRRRRHGVGGGVHDPLGGERHTERGEQLLRRRLGERGHDR
jgi:hypothetical protein